MSASTVHLLEAASEILGSEERLARYLNVGEPLLRAYMEDRRALPDLLLLRAVDLILGNLQRPVPPPQVVPQPQDPAAKLKSGSA